MSIRMLVVVAALAACGKSATTQEGFTSAEGKCAVDQDCVISCDVKGDCCHDPYCETVQLAATAQASAAANAKSCTDDDRKHCPQIGGIAQPRARITARCKLGACVAERTPLNVTGSGAAPGPGGSEVVDTRGYDRACKTKADCKIGKDDPCNHCSCADKPIAVTEVKRFDEAAAAIKCGPREPIQCGECRGFFADCIDGQCVAKPEN